MSPPGTARPTRGGPRPRDITSHTQPPPAPGAGWRSSPADKLEDPAGRFTSGLRVYDMSGPEKPAEIGFTPTTGLNTLPYEGL
jgi:hypothetical protein